MTHRERRVLGVLIEKGKTTPDSYPLSLNGLVTGCNQKSNREPVMALQDHEVEDGIATLKKKGLAQQIQGGGRVDKYRHVAYDAWKVDKVQLAILAELLLRGPQTEGELRTRASRMEAIADLDQLRHLLKLLADRGLVVYLTPEGRRGTMVTHGFHALEELERLRARLPADDETSAGTTSGVRAQAPPSPEWQERLERLEQEVATLRQELAALQGSTTSNVH